MTAHTLLAPRGFDINEDKGPYLARICSVMIVISAIAVVLRFLSRRVVKAPLLWDDWVILLAMPASWALCAIMLYSVKHFHFGRHLQWLQVQEGPSAVHDIRGFWLALYVSEVFYPIALCLIKFSILLFYWRIFHVASFKAPLTITAALVAAWTTATVLVAVFSCSPVHAYWDTATPHKCINTLQYFLGQAIPNILTDAFILILPLPRLWRLQISRSQKLALTGIFTLGGFVIVVSALRLNTIVQNQDSHDFIYDFIDLGVWTALESNLGIVAACLPSMRPLLKFMTHGSFRRYSKTLSVDSDAGCSTWFCLPTRKRPAVDKDLTDLQLNRRSNTSTVNVPTRVPPSPPSSYSRTNERTQGDDLEKIGSLQHPKSAIPGSERSTFTDYPRFNRTSLKRLPSLPEHFDTSNRPSDEPLLPDISPLSSPKLETKQ